MMRNILFLAGFLCLILVSDSCKGKTKVADSDTREGIAKDTNITVESENILENNVEKIDLDAENITENNGEKIDLDVDVEIVNNSLLKIVEKKGRDISCEDYAAKALFLTHDREDLALNITEACESDIGNVLDAEDCQEYVMDINIRNGSGEKVANTTVKLFPEIDYFTFAKNRVSFVIKDSRYVNCSNLNILLECKADKNSESSKVFENAGLDVELDYMTDKVLTCRAKVHSTKHRFLDLRAWTDWFQTDGKEPAASVTSAVWVILLVISNEITNWFSSLGSDMSTSSKDMIAVSTTLSLLVIVGALTTVFIVKRKYKR